MIKGVIKKQKSQRDEDHTQEINPKQSVSALIPNEKLNGLLNLIVCVNSAQQNIKCGIKGDKYFVDEVETQ
jgi:hypothetical protein